MAAQRGGRRGAGIWRAKPYFDGFAAVLSVVLGVIPIIPAWLGQPQEVVAYSMESCAVPYPALATDSGDDLQPAGWSRWQRLDLRVWNTSAVARLTDLHWGVTGASARAISAHIGDHPPVKCAGASQIIFEGVGALTRRDGEALEDTQVDLSCEYLPATAQIMSHVWFDRSTSSVELRMNGYSHQGRARFMRENPPHTYRDTISLRRFVLICLGGVFLLLLGILDWCR